jgi:hypothetical protein
MHTNLFGGGSAAGMLAAIDAEGAVDRQIGVEYQAATVAVSLISRFMS